MVSSGMLRRVAVVALLSPECRSKSGRKNSKQFENVSSEIKHFGTTVTNQNFIQEEIKRRLNSGNVCYHSVQNLLSSHLLPKNIKNRIYIIS
jgi:hypothetical protein